MLTRFCLYGFLKNQRYFEPFFMLALLTHEISFLGIGTLIACRSLTLNILEIPSGAIADLWGRRRCMIGSFVAYVISFLLFAWAPYGLVALPGNDLVWNRGFLSDRDTQGDDFRVAPVAGSH